MITSPPTVSYTSSWIELKLYWLQGHAPTSENCHLLTDCKLFPCIDRHTRIQGGTLDHIYTYNSYSHSVIN